MRPPPPIPPPSGRTDVSADQKPIPPPPPIPPPIPKKVDVIQISTSPILENEKNNNKVSLSDKVIDKQVKMKASSFLTGRTKCQTKELNPFGRGSSLSERPDDDDNEINNYGLSAGFDKYSNEKDQIVFNESTFSSSNSNKNNLPPPPPPPIPTNIITNQIEDSTVTKTAEGIKKLEIENPNDINIYHKLNYPVEWLCASIIVHFIQFGILLDLGKDVLGRGSYYFLLLSVVFIGLLLLASRFLTKKKMLPKLLFYMTELKPEDEMDIVSDTSIMILAFASIMEGLLFAIFCSLCAGRTLSSSSTAISKISLLSALQYGSITFLSFHRIIRPSNRCDPLRTMMELDVVNVCWDALDGATFFQLLEGNHDFSPAMDMSIRVLMSFWYVSVGFRVAIMHLALLSPGSWINKILLTPVLSLSNIPTVDRTLQGLRFRSMIVITMTFADIYAIVIRFTLWGKGKLDDLQQEMAIKNVIFLSNVYGAYDMYQSTRYHNWNTRDLGVGYNLKLPRRHSQMKFFKYLFAICYLLEGSLLGSVLVKSSNVSRRWVLNIGIDILLVILFLLYCRKAYNHRVQPPRFWLLPQRSFVIFPYYLAVIFSLVMAGNLFIARLPYIYYEYDNLQAAAANGSVWNYNFSLIVISVLTVVNLYTFTCPGNYHAIHDPTIQMVGQASMLEGSMDVLSTATLLSLASYHLSSSVNGAIVLFSLLELFNACQCFVIQVKLSNGNEDTPLDLVKWYSYLRCVRGVIDFGAFVLRVYVWYNFGAISSVFIIKNLYNLLHTAANFSNLIGARKYVKQTLFTEYVPPYYWYGLTSKDWKALTPLEY